MTTPTRPARSTPIRRPAARCGWSATRRATPNVDRRSISSSAMQPLTGYSVGFDLPLDDTKVTLGAFTPGTALDPGSAPVGRDRDDPDRGSARARARHRAEPEGRRRRCGRDRHRPRARTVLYTIELDVVAPLRRTASCSTARRGLRPAVRRPAQPGRAHRRRSRAGRDRQARGQPVGERGRRASRRAAPRRASLSSGITAA